MTQPRALSGLRLDGDAEDLNIEGDAASLRELAKAIRANDLLAVRFEDGPGFIRVDRRAGKLRIRFESPHTLVLEGDKDALNMLAANLRFTADGPEQPQEFPYHSHVDYFPSHPWLNEDSVSLTIWLGE